MSNSAAHICNRRSKKDAYHEQQNYLVINFWCHLHKDESSTKKCQLKFMAKIVVKPTLSSRSHFCHYNQFCMCKFLSQV